MEQPQTCPDEHRTRKCGVVKNSELWSDVVRVERSTEQRCSAPWWNSRNQIGDVSGVKVVPAASPRSHTEPPSGGTLNTARTFVSGSIMTAHVIVGEVERRAVVDFIRSVTLWHWCKI